MKEIYLIGMNTFREIMRDRILYGLVVFAILLLGVSLALGQLSYAEQTRISMNFGFMGIHLSAVILSIFVGSTLVSRELDKRTIMTLLSHAVSRGQFLVGKFLGMVFVLLSVLFALFLILSGIVLQLNGPITFAFPVALYGILLESMVLLAITIFFGVFCSPLLSVCFSLGLFLIGHWIGDLGYFADRSSSEGFKIFSLVANYVIPNLERFNWRGEVTYGDAIQALTISSSSFYGICWMFVFLLGSIFIFQKRDFV